MGTNLPVAMQDPMSASWWNRNYKSHSHVIANDCTRCEAVTQQPTYERQVKPTSRHTSEINVASVKTSAHRCFRSKENHTGLVFDFNAEFSTLMPSFRL
jgi:hypothetical protein